MVSIPFNQKRPRRERYANDLLTIGMDTTALAELQASLAHIPGAIDKARVAATNKTLAKAKTFTIRGLTQYTTGKRALFAGAKKKGMGGRVFSSNAVLAKKKFYGKVRVMGRRIQLIHFKAKDTRPIRGKGSRLRGRGVDYEVVKGQKQNHPHAFIRKNASTKLPHVYRRSQDSNGRYPLEWKYTEKTLYQMFLESPIPKGLESLVSRELPAQISSQIDRFLRIKRK